MKTSKVKKPPQVRVRKGFKRQENISINNNYSSLYHNCQALAGKQERFSYLHSLVVNCQLTESLETLELAGVTGDFALFIIQNIQTLGVHDA